MRGLGPTVLAVWLIIHGLIALANLSFRYDDVLMGALAMAAGVLLLIRR
ncbi:MAG: hypothetical protein WED00_10860 [Aquisalimonadaceae bacterium]